MCQNLKVIEWEIVGSPDPDNPNEQPPGTTIYDHRLYFHRVTSITTQQQSYNRQQYSKSINSSTLNTDFTMEEGFVVTAYVTECCNPLECLPS